MTENNPTPAERDAVTFAKLYRAEQAEHSETRKLLEAESDRADALAAIPVDAITDRLYSLSNDALKRIGDQCFYMIAERNADGVFS